MTELVRAAGGVLWRPAGDGTEVALVHRPRYDDWSLPKGKLDPGEHPLAGACRETLEETGVEPVAGPRLPTVHYEVTRPTGPVPKVVDYWALRADSSDERFTPNDEVDEVRWLPPAAADPLLSYDHDRPVLAAFAALPRITGIVVLVRHGEAGERSEWKWDDALRPLTPPGQAHAVRIAKVLRWYAPDRIVAARKVRCVQTVEPMAAALGREIELDDDFSEQRHAEDPNRVAVRLRELATAGGCAAVCSQGDVIPDAVAQLAGTDGLRLGELNSRKGSVWVLSFDGTRLAAADYLPDLEP